ncbi:ABC transporter ATP-binding protein [Dehalococcoidia bacterium]|nr:ABC transporter ATP-binding protein [Dehalococcoidia bacterium]
MVNTPPIKITGLSKYYGKSRGIVDLNLEVMPGEILGYLGPNGAGKTTTMRILMDFIRASEGTAQIFGMDSHKDSLNIRRNIGYLSTSPVLYENLTGREFLTYCMNIKGQGETTSFIELAERLNCDLDKKIDTLSHGNKQKVAIIRALAHKPQLVIMDEPTTGLDPLVQNEFESIIRGMAADGSTILFSSHVLSEVENICDRIAIIGNGKLIAVENVSDLKSKQTRILTVTFADNVDAQTFGSIPGIKNVDVVNNQLSFEISGPIDSIIKAIAKYKVLDIKIHEPDLEEIFLSYY